MFFLISSLRLKSFFYILFGTIFLGSSAIFVRLSTIDPFALGFFRFFFALPLLFCWMVKEKQITKTISCTIQDYLKLAIAGILFAFSIALWHLSLLGTSIVNATLLNDISPIYVAIFAWLFLKEKLDLKSLCGIISAFIGTCVLVLADTQAEQIFVQGDLTAIFSGLLFAGYLLIINHLRKRIDTPQIMFWSSFFCLYVLGIMTFIWEKNIIPTQASGWLPLLGLGIIVHNFGQALIAYSMKYVTVIISSMSMLMTHLFSVLFAWILFKEPLTFYNIVGGIMIITGVIIIHYIENRSYPFLRN